MIYYVLKDSKNKYVIKKEISCRLVEVEKNDIFFTECDINLAVKQIAKDTGFNNLHITNFKKV